MIIDLFFAIGLVFVLEGMLPFLKPEAWRRMVVWVIKRGDKQLRIFGLLLMLFGLLIVFSVHHLQ